MTEQPTRSPGVSWQKRRRLVALAVAIDAVLAAWLVLSGSGGMVRATAVFLFFLLAPGLALTGFLRLPDGVAELAVAIPLSLAGSTIVAGGMTLMTAWRPDTALVASVLVTVPLLARQAWPGRVRRESATSRPAPASGMAVPTVRLPAAGRAPLNGHSTGTSVNGEAAKTPAKRLGAGGLEPARKLPEEIGIGLIELARREIRADSAAVFLPDAGTWMVISGPDVPERTEALRVTAAHRLVREVLLPGRSRIIRASDRTPLDLAGLPFPASDHVLALPLPRADSVIVLSRANPPFHSEELRLLQRSLDLPETMLDLALKMRKLGDALEAVLDEPAEFSATPRPAGELPGRQPAQGRRRSR